MTKHTLYAYLAGGDFSAVADRVVERTEAFIRSRAWLCPDVWSVDQLRSATERELGLNLALPDPYQDPPNWFSDVEAVVGFSVELRREFGGVVALGIGDSAGSAEDITEIDSDQPDLAYIRSFIGIHPPVA